MKGHHDRVTEDGIEAILIFMQCLIHFCWQLNYTVKFSIALEGVGRIVSWIYYKLHMHVHCYVIVMYIIHRITEISHYLWLNYVIFCSEFTNKLINRM